MSFPTRVKQVVREIPEGVVMSYKDVASKAGYPNAFRAVASVMANNYDPAVPCHRVIKSDGTPGDYNRGGSAVKKKLLAAEGVIL